MSFTFDTSYIPEDPLERAMMLQNMVLTLSEGGGLDGSNYAELRSDFMKGAFRDFVPKYIRSCRDQSQLWTYLKGVATGAGSWSIRRNHIYETFLPLLDRLEGNNAAPADFSIPEVLSSFDPDGVHRAWERALERRHQDPEGMTMREAGGILLTSSHFCPRSPPIYLHNILPQQTPSVSTPEST